MESEYKNFAYWQGVETIEYEPIINNKDEVIAVNIFFDGHRVRFEKESMRLLRQIILTTFETIIEPEK